MARLAVALIAILVLALSAELTHTRLPPSSPAASSFQALEPHRAFSAEFNFGPPGQLTQPSTLYVSEDAPEPALIAYLVLVLISSVVAVGIVRHSARSKG